MSLIAFSIATFYGLGSQNTPITGNNVTWNVVGQHDCGSSADGYWAKSPGGNMMSICLNTTIMVTSACSGSMSTHPVELHCTNGVIFHVWPLFNHDTSTTDTSTTDTSTTDTSFKTTSISEISTRIPSTTATRGAFKVVDTEEKQSDSNTSVLVAIFGCLAIVLIIALIIKRRRPSTGMILTSDPDYNPSCLDPSNLGEDVIYFLAKGDENKFDPTAEHIYEVPIGEEREGITNPLYSGA